MLIALTEDERDGSSYMDSMCVLLIALFDDCNSLILALLLCNNMITMAVTRTTTLVISATTRELMVAIYTVLVHTSALFLSCDVVVVTITG